MSSKKKAKVVVKTPPSPKKPVQKGVQKSKSKMDACEEWMTENPGKARKDIIKVFQEKYGLTPAGSSTYFQIIRKRLNYK